METFLAGHHRTYCRREILLHSWEGRLLGRGAVLLMSHRCCCQMTYMLHTRLSALRRSLRGGPRFYLFGALRDASFHGKIGHCVSKLYNSDYRHLKEAGSPGLIVDPGRIVWSPYCPERELITFRH